MFHRYMERTSDFLLNVTVSKFIFNWHTYCEHTTKNATTTNKAAAAAAFQCASSFPSFITHFDFSRVGKTEHREFFAKDILSPCANGRQQLLV